MNFRDILAAYLEAAIWADLKADDGGSIEGYAIWEFAQDSIFDAVADVDKFIQQAGPLLDGWAAAQIGHDLWLTRNGHGAGFWDRDLTNKDELTAIAEKFGTRGIYVGDDEKLHIEVN